MIYSIIGEVTHVFTSTVVIRTSSGVEYEILISSQTASKLSALNKEAKREVRILTHLQHRDDSMTLFGFSDEAEKSVFLELIKVNGIGAKQALKILSGVQIKAFIQALDNNDLAYISSIPGIGPKTSQKIILALRDTIIIDQVSPKQSSSGVDSIYSDLVVSLCDMGYDKKQVVSTIQTLLNTHKEVLSNKSLHESEEFLFKHAIIALG
jgi:Holliday junction DNA helicase RuvA